MDIRTTAEIFSLSLIREIENNFSIEIDENTKELLSEDLDLVMALEHIGKNSMMVKHLDFDYEDIQFVKDPDEPESNILTICISINEKNIDKLIDIEENIIEGLFKDLSLDMLEKISIVNIFR